MPDYESGSYHSRGGNHVASNRFQWRDFMSVYTSVDSEQLEGFLRRYDIGEARAFTPVAAGVTNSNYMLDTDQGRYVLTLYEHHSDDELDYMLRLQRHLAGRGVRCSQPVGDRRGDFFSSLNQRPAAVITRIAGEVQNPPSPQQCALIGAELARFHLAGADFDHVRANPRGIDWMVAVRDMLADYLGDADQQAIEATLRAAQNFDLEALPRGAIHADLFHDNALFNGAELGGILDFDYACTDAFAFDIAVLLNDWCIDPLYGLVAKRVDAVLVAYRQHRELATMEIEALPLMLRLAALRFWLSRLYDKVFPLAGELTYIKCPDAFRDMHRLRSAQRRLDGVD
jgi:homoserine kinase type II